MGLQTELTDTNSRINGLDGGQSEHNASLTTFDTNKHCNIKPNAPKQIPPMSESDIDRFLFYVDVREPDECWLWRGGTNGKEIKYRYGSFKIGKQTVYPHRVAYALKHGSIPAGMTIDHSKAKGCTSKLCCNPRHLDAVTHEENLRRTRSPYCRRGHLKTGKGRNCLECSRVWVERFRQKHGLAELQRSQIDRLAFGVNTAMEPGLESGEYQ